MFQLGPFTNLHLLGAILVSGLLQLGAVTTPATRQVFGTTAHPALEWVFVFDVALAPVTIVELFKLARTAFSRGTDAP